MTCYIEFIKLVGGKLLLHNEFNNYNNTGVRMLDYVYFMTLTLF